jgi:hypothetical protein
MHSFFYIIGIILYSYVLAESFSSPSKVNQQRGFDMAQNFNPNQQQPHSNPQYNPLPNQHFPGAPQQSYIQATQQTYTGQPVAQYGMPQYSNQASMQPPTQQLAKNTQPQLQQQQPSYQYYQQSLPSAQW